MNTILTMGSPESAGLSSACIINTLNEIEEKGISMHSFLLWKSGYLAAEGYYAPCKKDDLHRMFSVTKSFVSIAIGLLQDEGLLSLNDPIVKFFPEYVPAHAHPWLLETTIRDMLSMRSCHASTTYDKFSSKKNWVQSFFTTPPTHKPGTLFHYDTSATHTLCALVEKLSHMELLAYLRKKVLDEIGFSKEAFCLKDGSGVSMGGSGLMATSRDLMLFALLILHKGKLNGKQYVPADYIEEATSFQTPTCVTGPIPSESQGYGLQFWIGEHNTIVCYGMGGQLAILFPEYDTAIVTTADTQGYQGGNQVIYDAVFHHILPELNQSRAPRDPDETEKRTFDAFLSRLEIRPLQSNPCTPALSAFCRTFSLFENPFFDAVSFDLGCSKGCCTFHVKNTGDTSHDKMPVTNSIPIFFGIGSIQEGLLCMTTHMGNFVKEEPVPVRMRYGASAAWLSQNCLYIKIHLLDTSVGSIHIQAVFGEKEVTIFLRKQEETLFGEFSGHLYGTIQTTILS